MKRMITAAALALFIFSCSRVPITGRKQINLISSSEMNSMSLTSYNQFLTENKKNVLTSGPEVDMVKRVGARIAKAVEGYLNANNMSSMVKQFNWEFNVVRDNTVNAWCMAGGKVVVYTGILSIAPDDASLAVVLGHEIAHAVAQHGSERMSQELIQQYGGQALSSLLSTKSNAVQNILLSAYGVGSQVFGILPYSRLHESEADKLGLVFMAMAGYNPEVALDFWTRMASASNGASTPAILSTHPSDDTRIKQIQAFLPEALKYYSSSSNN
ncbi:MAG: M48 family metallopeptidase [Chitinophagales bacterium]|nr:M48 family metallopeptidase [Chitinophagales bacterium]